MMFKYWKKALLLSFILLLTGCDVTYNLGINSRKAIEDVTFSIDDGSDYGDGMDLYIELYENFGNIAVPLSKKDGDFSFDGDKRRNIEYYEFKKNEDEYSLDAIGHFDDISIQESSMIYLARKEDVISDTDKSILINISGGLSVFDSYKALENLTVNIKVNDYRVIYNDADRVVGNTYTWHFDRDNYDNKNITLKIDKTGSLIATSNSVIERISSFIETIMGKGDKSVLFLVLFVVAVIGSIYLLLKHKQTSKNKF